MVVAIAIAAYAIHGIIADDLVMPYRVGQWRLKNFKSLHLHGIWEIGGSVCLLLGAAGLAILAYGVIGAKPGVKSGTKLSRNLATLLITVGAVFFLGISWFAQWFVR